MVQGCWSPYSGHFQLYLLISVCHLKITFIFAFLWAALCPRSWSIWTSKLDSLEQGQRAAVRGGGISSFTPSQTWCHSAGSSMFCPSLPSWTFTWKLLLLGSRSSVGILTPHCACLWGFFQPCQKWHPVTVLTTLSAPPSSKPPCLRPRDEFYILLGFWPLELLLLKLFLGLSSNSQMVTSHVRLGL